MRDPNDGKVGGDGGSDVCEESNSEVKDNDDNVDRDKVEEIEEQDLVLLRMSTSEQLLTYPLSLLRQQPPEHECLQTTRVSPSFSVQAPESSSCGDVE